MKTKPNTAFPLNTSVFTTYLISLLLLLCGTLQAQSVEDSLKSVLKKSVNDTSKVKTLIALSFDAMHSDISQTASYAKQAKELSEKLGYIAGIADAYRYMGLASYFQGNYGETVEYWQNSLANYDSINDRGNVARLLSNIGAVYFNQSDDVKALEFYLKSQKVAEEIGDSLRLVTALANIGAIYGKKKVTFDKALDYDIQALNIAERLNDNNTVGTLASNIGEIYMGLKNDSLALLYFKRSLEAHKGTENEPYPLRGMGKVYLNKKDYFRAIHYHTEAYEIAKKLDAKMDMSQSLRDLGETYNEVKEYQKAIDHYHRALALADSINSKEDQRDIYEGLSTTYSNIGDYKNALKYQTLLSNVKDTLYNIEFDQKMSGQMFNFQIEKKQNEIALLNKDKELQDLDIKRQKFAKNAFMVGLGLILIIAFVILRMYFTKVKTNKILDKQKDQIETLLLNTLPADVVEELNTKGSTTPKHYESVSVLFTDFKNFTKIASKLTPDELVAELTTFFSAYDDIIGKYGLEKIKTIGDAYMCAGGVPNANTTHPLRIIKAGLEIQEYMTKVNADRADKGLTEWGLRMGIHTGPVVAGVVGKKKYAYDIWGDTVNIASRMESNGEPGRVNISAATYDLVKDKFSCSHRGKIEAKNIGEIDMYFVDHEIEEVETV
ncbi:MAG: tetratricopeptide repeat protein [Bacteroidia bacterium]|nr:tetratricopeptide repeat protein [Bacteroidia bacterium]